MDSRATSPLKSDSGGSRRALLGAVLVSLLLHGLVLGPFGAGWRLPWWLHGQHDKRVIRRLPSPAATVQLTLLSPSQASPAATPAPVAPTAAAPTSPVATLTPPSTPSPAYQAPQADSDEGYLPSEFLSKVATPTAEIDLQDIAAPDAAGRLQLLLWIDPAGDVTQVDVETTEAPDWFTQQVRDRFKQARFEPGQRDGQPVASLMRIEVLF